MADTTWRMAVPTLLLAGLGLYLDRHYTNGPWFTLIGLVLGLVIAARLVKRQLTRIPQ